MLDAQPLTPVQLLRRADIAVALYPPARHVRQLRAALYGTLHAR